MGHGGARRSRKPGLGVAVWLAAVWFASGGSGCVSAVPETAFWERTQLDHVWPLPPEQARIGHLGAMRSARDLGKPRNWLQKLADRVTGESPMSLVKPLALARNRNGLLVVTDPSFPTVHFFDLQRREYRWLEKDVSSVLGAPVGVAVDDLGNAYVTDSIRRRIFVFDDQRRLVGEIGEGVLERPTGIALGPAQDLLYVVDTVACELFVFETNGRLVRRFGGRGAGPGELNAPTYVAVAPDGTIAISDTLNFRVQTFASDGTLLNSIGRAGNSAGDFARPKGVAYDRSGRLYVVDGGFDNVQIFDPQGRLLLVFGVSGNSAGQFNLPVGLFLDSSRTLWIADSYNARVQAFRLLVE
jgi:DNA-binding beta-propeller fold protein YncE